MIILRGIELVVRCDLGHVGLVIFAALVQLSLIMLRFLLLLIVVVEDRTAVLCTYVFALLVKAGRVMGFPEYFQQLIISDDRRVVDDLESFRMPGSARAY